MSHATTIFRSTAWRACVVSCIFCWNGASISGTLVAQDTQSDPLIAGLNALSAGQHELAAELLANFVAESLRTTATASSGGNSRNDADIHSAAERTLRGMIGAGQALRQLGRHAEALEFFDAAVVASGESSSRNPLRLAAAQCAMQSQSHARCWSYCDDILQNCHDEGIRTTAQRLWIRAKTSSGLVLEAWERFQQVVAEQHSAISEVDRREWSELALSIGFAALTKNEPAIAAIAFRWYLEHAGSDASRESATLGLAWAAASGAEQYEQAATKLLDFAEAFPSNSSVPRALLAAVVCYARNQQPQQAIAICEKIMHQFPDAPEATAALVELLKLAPAAPLDLSQLKLLRHVLETQPLTIEMATAAIRGASNKGEPELWQEAVRALMRTSQSQRQIQAVLQRLDELELTADAERLAAQLLGGTQPGDSSSEQGPEPATEMVCRWAAERNHWALLSSAARSPEFIQLIPQLSQTSNRLLAEGLIQSNLYSDAKSYLDELVEHRGATDFETLLRRAELSLTLESKPQAEMAIARANSSATNFSQRSLVSLLRAQWMIRGAEMEEARITLDSVLRNGEASAEIKARAQWLVGETYLLQRQFKEAVDSYRLVETIDASGQWAAASLVQAGRAFEQLGRPRDAAICYMNLLRRFADSPHSLVARERLASLKINTELK